MNWVTNNFFTEVLIFHVHVAFVYVKSQTWHHRLYANTVASCPRWQTLFRSYTLLVCSGSVAEGTSYHIGTRTESRRAFKLKSAKELGMFVFPPVLLICFYVSNSVPSTVAYVHSPVQKVAVYKPHTKKKKPLATDYQTTFMFTAARRVCTSVQHIHGQSSPFYYYACFVLFFFWLSNNNFTAGFPMSTSSV